jgi:uncharacterized protein YbjT (DUF2867 family)
MRILVLGATGYVATRLIPAAVAAGHEVVAGARNLDGLTKFWWSRDVTPVEVDVLDSDQTRDAMTGVDAVVYLIHGMGCDDFESVDRAAALRVRTMVAETGVDHLVYVSGLVPDVPKEELSAHLRSRLEVEEILLDSAATTIVLRAAMILGASSTSYEVLAQLSRRLPVTVVPPWMDTTIEPIAVTDVVAATLRALQWQGDSRSLDLGDGCPLKYADLLTVFAEEAGIDRTQIKIPFAPKALVAEVASRIVDVPTSTVRALMDSLEYDMVADPEQSVIALPGERVELRDAIRRALAPQTTHDPAHMDPLGSIPGDPPWAEGID